MNDKFPKPVCPMAPKLEDRKEIKLPESIAKKVTDLNRLIRVASEKRNTILGTVLEMSHAVGNYDLSQDGTALVPVAPKEETK